jgi:hypothetical protein
MSRGNTRFSTAIVLTLAALVPGGALAEDGAPRTEAASGTFSASPVNVKLRTCTGDDGPYLEIRGGFGGTIVSSDPRLTGRLEFVAHALVNQLSGLGTFEGSFHVRSVSAGGGASGTFHTVVTERSLNHGFARGKVGGEGAGQGAEDFFARFESTVDPGLNVTGSFGDVGDDRTPAVIQSGHCTGPWLDIP